MSTSPDAPRHLIHPGFAKAGSTFLQEWFERHPQMRFVPHHLGGFRDVFDLAEAARERGREPSREHWRYYVTSNELLGSGGVVPYGCPLFSFRMLADADLRTGQRTVCEMLREAYPQAKVLIVTRGFGAIIRSLYSQYVKLGGGERFSEFLEHYAAMLEQWLDVDHVVKTYRDAFGDDLLVLPYESMRDDAAAFCRTIEAFLELDPAPAAVPGVRNPSLDADALYWYAGLSRGIVAPVLDRLPPERAAPLYAGYALKVLASPGLARGARWLGRALGREQVLDVPPAYLERFRGKASCLASSEAHAPYLDAYLEPAPGER